jgi:hypothetical protein
VCPRWLPQGPYTAVRADGGVTWDGLVATEVWEPQGEFQEGFQEDRIGWPCLYPRELGEEDRGRTGPTAYAPREPVRSPADCRMKSRLASPM